MQTIVTAAGAAHFLSLVPHLLGYRPRNSIVVVPMRGGRSLGALRLDVPPDDDVELCDQVASSILGMVCRIPEADAAVTVVYTDVAIAATSDLPHSRLVRALQRSADACGLRLTDALTVAADGWGSHFDVLTPEGGRSLLDLETVPAGVDLPGVIGDQASGAVLPQHSAAERREVGGARRSLECALTFLCGMPGTAKRDERIDPAALTAACLLDDLPALFEGALTWDVERMSPMQAAMLGWCLSRPSLRDVALVQWATDSAGGEAALDAQRRWEDGEPYPDDLGMIMWGDGARPDPDRLEAGLALVRHVAALTPKRQRPGALAMCAWLSWALGRSSHAERYTEQALTIDPNHGLSEIVQSFVQAGHLPDWAFRRGDRLDVR